MARYNNLSNETSNKILEHKKANYLSPFSAKNEDAIRRIDNPHDYPSVWRTPFIKDVDKIMHCPFFNRYSDKTQVFSLYKNDDLSRRSLHVQLVSRIARTIGSALSLNTDLIEAIALGHDMGHTPFGHVGERILNDISKEKRNKSFLHNFQSVRVLDEIFPLNLTLQTLDGIACHNGEAELSTYTPSKVNSFNEFDLYVKESEKGYDSVKNLTPLTLEGCVVRLSDIIAYLGKDRHDAEKHNPTLLEDFSDTGLGLINSEIINNLIVNVIENSLDKPYIKLGDECFSALKKAKKENYNLIYLDNSSLDVKTAEEMMRKLYDRLYLDLEKDIKSSPVFSHHISYVEKPYYKRKAPYLETDKHQIIVDFIASMTDDFFIELFKHLFPKSSLKLNYIGYFE